MSIVLLLWPLRAIFASGKMINNNSPVDFERFLGGILFSDAPKRGEIIPQNMVCGHRSHDGNATVLAQIVQGQDHII